MGELFNQFLIIYGIFIFSLITPGPDFFIVVRISLNNGIKAGIYCAIGISLAIILHISYSVFGVANLIQRFFTLYLIILIFATFYLSFIIYQIISSLITDHKNHLETQTKNLKQSYKLIEKTPLQALKEGILINLTNVKAATYFVAVFSPLVANAHSNTLSWLVFFSFWLSTLLWFVIVAIIFSTARVRIIYLKYRVAMELITILILGLLLIYIINTIVKLFI